MSLRWTDEAEPGKPYWWEGLDPVRCEDTLPERCDLLVVGAGYTGLSAALAAHECGARVVVVDAGVPGKGASSRNGGMVGAHPRLGWEVLERQYGAETADAIFAEAKGALAWARELIKHEGIDCDFQDTGRIQLAWTPQHFEAQKKLAAHVTTKSDVGVRIVERADLGAEIGTSRYFGGMLFPEHAALHPAKYHRGLLNAVQARGIPVLDKAAVTGFERDAQGFAVETARGPIRAEKMLLATNGYTTLPFRWHLARVFPLPSYLIATEELPADLLARLAPGRRMMVETRARHSYFRLSPDGRRMLFGGRAAMRPISMLRAARRLKATMCGIWPELENVRLSHAWTGNTGFSFGHMPHVGERDGLHYAMGFSGSGTVLAPYLGAKAAYRAMGDARGDTAYAQTALRRHVLHPVRHPYFLYPADLWYRHWVDRKENRQAR